LTTTMMNRAVFSIPMICVGCHATLDHVSNMEDTKKPEVGDFTICINCGALMVFTSGLGVAPAKLTDIPVQYRAHFARTIFLIQEIKRVMGEPRG
jgi:hypothetical protein